MAKHRVNAVLSGITGVLLIVAGIRDLVAPGFFAMVKHQSSRLEMTILVLLGVIFLICSGIAIRQRKPTAMQP